MAWAREVGTTCRSSNPQGRLTSLAGAAARRGDSRPRAHPLAARLPQRGPVAGRPQGAAASRGS
ncbi:hypothetical protein B296_00019436, partial [Ensete ventricosum]